MPVSRRLVFGAVAELYDRHRPAYPGAVADDLIAAAAPGAGERVLEVGAGTGKATRLFGERGARVLAVEPSAEMAAVARRSCAGLRNVEIVEVDFERFDPAGERFRLLYAAQAWHWIDPAVRFERARAALGEGDLLAAFWNRTMWEDSELRSALLGVYAEIAPQMETGGLMHPANEPPRGDEGWAEEIAATPGFRDPVVRMYEWSASYTGAEYAGLLATMSEFRLLHDELRDRLLGAIADTIDDHGGLTLPMVTRLHLARAV